MSSHIRICALSPRGEREKKETHYIARYLILSLFYYLYRHQGAH